MRSYLVTFTRTTRETVKVYADSANRARDIVYDSFGQDMQSCKSIDLQEVEFEVNYVEREDQ